MGFQPKFARPKNQNLRTALRPHLNLRFRGDLNLFNTNTFTMIQALVVYQQLIRSRTSDFGMARRVKTSAKQISRDSKKEHPFGLKVQCWVIPHTCQITKRANEKGSSSSTPLGGTTMTNSALASNQIDQSITIKGCYNLSYYHTHRLFGLEIQAFSDGGISAALIHLRHAN